MVYRFFISINRIILLTAENKFKIITQHLVILIVCVVFTIRDISEDLLRTGSQFVFLITGYFFDLFVIEEQN